MHDLAGLEVMSAVVERGSFVRAGEIVGLTQSGVSRAVARLEQRVGVRLFDRNARAVTLTDEGRRFYERVRPLLANLQDAVDTAAGDAAEVRGRLRVNVDAFFASHVLGPRLGRWLAAHPQLELDLVVSDSAGNLVANGFDIAVRFGEPEPSALVARRVLQTRILTTAAPAYLARRGRPRHPRELVNHTCMQFRDPRTGRPFEWEFHRGGRKLTVKVGGPAILNDIATALAMCLAGDCISQPMELGTEELIRTGALVALFPRWQEELFPLYLLYPSRQLPPAKVRAFIELVTGIV